MGGRGGGGGGGGGVSWGGGRGQYPVQEYFWKFIISRVNINTFFKP